MENKVNHLYVHIPFCKEICTYCDFYRFKTSDEKIKNDYIEKIINEIKSDSNIYKTIYIGGGTPNYLSDNCLIKLLNVLKNRLSNNYELTIECNPEFLSESQAKIFRDFGVNRVSLGVQTLNESILKLLKRTHNNKDVINALNNLKTNGIKNISIDLIYNLPLLKIDDLKKSFNFILENEIKHISFYSLEIKKGSILNKEKYKINDENEAKQLSYIIKEFEKLNYDRYEISNWAINNQYYSQHNLAYWNLNSWKAIGVAGYGFENNLYYYNEGNIKNWIKIDQKWSDKDIIENIFIMGLRKKEGVDLSIERNLSAFNKLKDKFNFDLISIENNYLKVKNIDLLNEVLIDLI